MLTILSLVKLTPADIKRIEAIDARIRVIDAAGQFNGEIRETWPQATVQRYVPNTEDTTTREERDALLADAEIVVGGFPFPLDLRQRAPKLKWFHQRPAGASNLQRGDLWRSDIIVTTSRGYGDSSAIAEFAIAGLMYFAKGFNQAALDKQQRAFQHHLYRPIKLAGKTLLVIGAGGIGQEVARQAAALGMRVVGTRRQSEPEPQPPFERIETPSALPELLAESIAVAVCCQWTPETTNLLDAAAFAAMADSAIMMNIARGEIIDETALLDALNSGKLRGAVLDVYVGEFEHEPPLPLWSHPNVLITPHTSSMSDHSQHGSVDVFCDNLQRYLQGKPLSNVIDWERGY